MQILLAAYACDPDKGSEPGIGWNWAVTLANQGHKVHCLTSKHNQTNVLLSMENRVISDIEFHFIGVWAWLELLRNLLPFPIIYLHYLVWQYQAYRYAIVLRKSTSIDLVHHVTYGSIQLGSHMWRLEIPFIFGPVGGGEKIPGQLKKYLGFGWGKEICRTIVEVVLFDVFKTARRCLRKATLVLVTNPGTCQLAARLGATKVEYFLDMGIKNATPPMLKKQEFADRPFNLLWVGKLVAIKGLDMVLEGLKEANNPNTSLTVVGNGLLKNYYKLKARRLGISRQVHFISYLPYNELKKLYISHDALVYCPLRSAFGGQLLEAMSYGLPVIGLDLHGAGFFLPEEAGIKLKLNKNEQITQKIGQAINKMAGSFERYQTMSIHAYQFAVEHEWRYKVDTMIQKYQKILDAVHTPALTHVECSV